MSDDLCINEGCSRVKSPRTPRCRICNQTSAANRWRDKDRASYNAKANASTKRTRDRNVEVWRKRSLGYHRASIGFTPEVESALALVQRNASGGIDCAICGVELTTTGSTKLVRDHDHSTGQARAFLCQRCNAALGQYECVIQPNLNRVNSYLGES